ncbi:MAG: type VI secretion system baseplate subunit TssK [Planctomycetota bacterium]|nr:type VI secretion system baseplate subunit TssK [Planctomycetota bacterium]
MSEHAVHWHEGMALSPHHFQAGERSLRKQIALSEDWACGYSYGIRHIDLDEDALSNWHILPRRLHCRLRDGTHVRYPEDAQLLPAKIKPETFRGPDDRIMVYLAVSRSEPGIKVNAGPANSRSDYRHFVEAEDTEDENEPGKPEMVQYRWPNMKILVGDRNTSGYENIPLMRLKLGATADPTPEVDTDYIPPVLACDAWTYLHQNIIGNIYHQTGASADTLARQIRDNRVAFQASSPEHMERIFKLQALNTALGYLTILRSARGIHPLTAYMELCRVVGLLAMYRAERRMPEVPDYDHDDLGKCFHAIRSLLEVSPETRRQYTKRPFVGDGLQMRVRMDREWLEPTWKFFIGVESPLTDSQVDTLLRKQMDMKVGPFEQVDMIYTRAQSDVPMERDPDPPPDFPKEKWTYWKVDRDSYMWKEVEKTLNLGIRFNERQVEGDFNGSERVVIKRDNGELISITLALYAIPI